MNKFLKIILAFLPIFFALSSCSGIDTKEEMVTNDNYYVKYVLFCSYPRFFSDWSVSTPQGEYSKNNYQTRRWEQTYGPVKKGFKCEAQVGRGEPTIEIYVSINQEPFALKTTKIGHSASYTIDF